MSMYWILNYLPLVISFIEEIYSIIKNYCGWEYNYNNTSTIISILWLVILSPVYLLCVNILFTIRSNIRMRNVACMVSVILGRTTITLIANKIKYNSFLSDTPIGLFCFLVGLPTAIILIGSMMIYIVGKLRNKHKN